MKKKWKIIGVAVLAISTCSFSGIHNLLTHSQNSLDELERAGIPEIHEEHVTYYRTPDGRTVREDQLEAERSFSWAEIESKIDDGDGMHEMLVYAELAKGFEFDFENMEIKGIPYYNSNYSVDGKHVDGSSIKLSDGSKDTERYLLMFACTEEFSLEEISLEAYNLSNSEFKTDIRIGSNVISLDEVDLHQTYSSSIHFISVGGHYYVWDQYVPKVYLPCEDSGMCRVAVTEETIIWSGEGGSVEELFTAISDNYGWANELDGEIFDSRYSSLSYENIEGYGACLVKTARTDIEDETANPNYITFTERGHETMYFVIV